MLAVVVIGASAFGAASSFAGGDAWRFKILKIRVDNDGAGTAELDPIDKPERFPRSCKALELHMSYQRHWFYTERHPTKEQHLKAVEMLIRAQKEGSTVDLGEVGTGSGAVSGRVCDLRSRGLAIIDGAIYSFFKWP